MEPPSLATTAVLHLGTLIAVVWYFRHDLARLARRSHPDRRLAGLIAIATLPALAAGAALEWWIDDLNDRPRAVAVALMVTGLVLAVSEVFRRRGLARLLDSGRPPDAVVVGLAQAAALIPGISRSGMTIVAGMGRGFEPGEAARFAFLIAVPIILISGMVQAIELVNEGGFEMSLLVGVVVAAIAGYLAIAGLLRLIRRTGLGAFAVYCVAFGLVALVAL